MHSDRRWRLEPLEARLLLSADPLTAGLMALAPQADDDIVGVLGDPATLLTDQTLSDASINLPNSLRISGAVVIQATSGNANVGNDNTDYVGGHSAATTDTLEVRSDLGDVRFRGAIGDGTAASDALNALTVIAFDDVTFDREIVVDGDLVIDAGGIVTFEDQITLRHGGSLSIVGATQVVFKAAVTLEQGLAATAGDVLIEADEIDLQMGDELFGGSGLLTLRAATPGLQTALLSPTGAGTAGVLNLETAEMRAFADGFASIVVGQAGAGVVTLGAATALDGLSFRDSTTVQGATITVADYSDPNAMLRLGDGDSLSLLASGNIELHNEIETDALTLVSTGGSVSQGDTLNDNRGDEALRTLAVTVAAATGITLDSVEANSVQAHNSGAGDITIAVNAARSTTRFDASEITGSVQIVSLAQDAGGGTNAISLVTGGGSITLAAGAGITIAGSGGLTLTAGGAGSDLTLDAPVTLIDGPVTLTAADALTTTANGTITAAGAADIALSAGTGHLSIGAAVTSNGGSVSFESGGALDFSGITLTAGPGGEITLAAEGDLTIGIVEAANAITLRSQAGRLIDGLAGDAANLRGEAAAVTLEGAAGVGASGAPLRGSVGSLQASVSTSGSIFFTDETALAVTGLTTAGGGSGAIVVRSLTGALTTSGAVVAGATGSSGHILLEALAGDLTLGAGVESAGGSISLLAAQALLMSGAAFDVRSAGSGQTLDLRAGGALTMDAGQGLVSTHGAVRAEAGAAMQLGRIDAGTAGVALQAGGSVTRVAASGPDVSAASLRVIAGGDVGSGSAPLALAVSSVGLEAGGSAFVSDGIDTTVGSLTGVAVKRIADDGSAFDLAADGTLAGLDSGGTLVLDVTGALDVDQAVAADGPVRVSASGAIALSAPVNAVDGTLSLLAGSSLSATAAADLTAGGAGELDIEAGGAITLDEGHLAATGGGDMRLVAGGTLVIGQLDADTGDLVVQGVSIAGVGGTDITGSALRLAATGGDAGSGDAPLTLTLTQVAASASGGLFLSETDGIAVVALAATDSARVGLDGQLGSVSNPALAGLVGGGAVVLAAGGGVSSAADAPLQAGGTLRLASGGAVTLAGSLEAGGAASVQAAETLVTGAALTAASLDLIAGTSLGMAAGTTATAAMQWLQAGGAITVATLAAAGGSVALIAGGDVIDADAGSITTEVLLIDAGGAVGSGSDAIESNVATLAGAAAAGGLFIAEADDLAVGSVSAAIQRVAADGSVVAAAADTGTGLASGGALVLANAAGDLALVAALQAAGSLRLDAAGALSLGAAVGSGGGAATLRSGAAITITAAGRVETAGGALDIVAGAALTMADGSALVTGGGHARVAASGAVTLAQLVAGAGAASVLAASVGGAGSGNDITAAVLRLETTGGSIGAAGAALELAVGQLAALATGDLFAVNDGALVLDIVDPFSVQRVGNDGTVAAVAGDAALAGLTAGGVLVLVNAGSVGQAGTAAVSAGGNLRLEAAGDSADLSLASDVHSAAGHLSLAAGRDVSLGAAATTDSAGQSLVIDAGRHLTLGEGSTVTTHDGSVLLSANGDLSLESVTAGTGTVALLAGRVIDGDAEVDVVAAGVRITAGGGVGSGSDALELQTAALTASAGSDGLFVQDDAGLAIVAFSMAVQRVAADGSAASVTLEAQEGLTSDGALVAVLASGDLSVDTAVAGGATRLEAAGGRILVNAGIGAIGPATLIAAGDLALAAGGDVAAGVSIDLQAGATLTMADDTVVSSDGGTIRAAAAGSMTLGSLTTTGGVSLWATTIADSGSTDIDISAAALRVVTTGTGTSQGFGSGAKVIQTQVGTLAADVAGIGAGGLFMTEADGLVVGAVGPLVVARVAADGSSADLADAALADVVSGGNLILVSTRGDVELQEGDADDRSIVAGGNLRLEAVAGRIVVGADIVSTAGHVSLLAAGDLLLNADLALERSGRNADLQAGGAITAADGTAVMTDNSHARLAAGGVLTIDRITAGSGRVSLIGSSVVEAGSDSAAEVTASGLRIVAGAAVGTETNRIETQVGTLTARAAAGGMWFEEADAVRIGDVAVNVQRVGLTGTTAALADATQSDLVTTGGNGDIALTTLNGDIDLLDGTAPADGRSLSADGTGRVLLDVNGAGAALDVTTDHLVQAGPVTISSDLRLQGTYGVTAGGAITIEGAVDGHAGNPADVLELHAAGAVLITGAIGATTPLDALLIAGATDVTIGQPISVTGDVTIVASGIVTLTGPIELGSGTLRIVGASRIILGDVVLASGDLELATNVITLNGTITGAADAEARIGPAAAGGTVAYGGGIGDLALSAAQLARLSGFSSLVVGAADAGAVTMAAGSSLDTGGRDLTLLAAGDIGVGRILAGGAGVTLSSSGGTISDSGNDTSTDITAGWLMMRGRGPALAAGVSATPAAIDVDAPRLDLDAASGVVLRDSGADGRARYNLLAGGTLYQLLETATGAQREASAAPGSAPSAVADWLNALRPLAALRDDAAGDTRRGVLAAGGGERGEGGATLRYLETLTAGAPEAGGWLARRLEQSLVLSAAGPAVPLRLPAAWDDGLRL